MRFKPGDRVRVVKEGVVYEGIVLPKTEFSSEDVIILKLDNGYNVGLSVKDSQITVVSENVVDFKIEEPSQTFFKGNGSLKISFLSTGGTIVSKVDYETGAVRPAITAAELVDMVPEFKNQVSELEVFEVYRLFSEDLTPKIWEDLSFEVAKRVKSGVNGVLIAHGTDTMTYTAAALAFSLRNLPVPIVIVGAQRSSDRPSTDAVLNLKASLKVFAEAPFGEVVVCMHGHISDEYVLVHRGVKVRKMHSSRRDAFQSINDIPLAKVIFPSMEFKLINNRYIPRARLEDFELINKFSDKVALIKFYPGFDCSLIDMLIDKGFKGLVFEGTGLGHVRNACVDSIARASESEVLTVMTTQTLFGRVNLNVYSTGRKLIKAGVIPAEDMLPEVAFVKLSWLLGSYNHLSIDEIKRLFLSNIANEINYRHEDFVYPRWYHGD